MRAELKSVLLKRIVLKGAELTEAELTEAELTGAELKGNPEPSYLNANSLKLSFLLFLSFC